MESLVADFIYQFSNLQHFHFLRPYWLFIVIPLFWVLNALTTRDDNLAMWRPLISTEILNSITIKGNSTNFVSPLKVTWLIAIILSIILAGPTWTQQPSPFTENKSALIIALDVSETMNQSDVQPSRLLRAKQKILALLNLRGDSNTALIAYSGSAHTVMPITNDSNMIRHFLDALNNQVMPVPGKQPESALTLTESLLKTTGVSGTMLLIGDGANQNAIEKFSKFFSASPHQLIIWGVGEPASSLDSEQNHIIPLQVEQLNTLSNRSNGRLITMTHNQDDIESVNRHIENKLIIVDDESLPWYDAGYSLTFILGLLYLFWFRKGWTLQW